MKFTYICQPYLDTFESEYNLSLQDVIDKEIYSAYQESQKEYVAEIVEKLSSLKVAAEAFLVSGIIIRTE